MHAHGRDRHHIQSMPITWDFAHAPDTETETEQRCGVMLLRQTVLSTDVPFYESVYLSIQDMSKSHHMTPLISSYFMNVLS